MSENALFHSAAETRALRQPTLPGRFSSGTTDYLGRRYTTPSSYLEDSEISTSSVPPNIVALRETGFDSPPSVTLNTWALYEPSMTAGNQSLASLIASQSFPATITASYSVVTGNEISADIFSHALTGNAFNEGMQAGTAWMLAAQTGSLFGIASSWGTKAVHFRVEKAKLMCWTALAEADSGLRRSVVEQLRSQVGELLDIAEWETEDPEPSVQSFRQLLTFLTLHNDLRTPSLTLSNGSNFVASFFKTRSNIVRLEFHPDGWVRWLVYLSPVGRDPHSEKGAGFSPLSKVRAQVEPSGAWSWMHQ